LPASRQSRHSSASLKFQAEHKAALQAEREEEARKAAERRAERAAERAERAIKRCSFCRKAQSEIRALWGDEDRYQLICNECVALAVKAIGA
jgi:ClpX C4-type zinc finger